MTTHVLKPVPNASPRTVDLEPQPTDADFPAYSKRIAKAIGTSIPALLRDCEWSGQIYSPGISRTFPTDWKTRAPIAYVRQGTESPIVTLAGYSRSTGETNALWHAKVCDDDKALEILAWLTRSINWMA